LLLPEICPVAGSASGSGIAAKDRGSRRYPPRIRSEAGCRAQRLTVAGCEVKLIGGRTTVNW
jgi:hypothetical protein